MSYISSKCKMALGYPNKKGETTQHKDDKLHEWCSLKSCKCKCHLVNSPKTKKEILKKWLSTFEKKE